MKASDATKEEIDRWVEVCRKPYVRDGKQPTRERVIATLAAHRDELLALARDIYEWTAEGPLNLSAADREKLAALLARIGAGHG